MEHRRSISTVGADDLEAAIAIFLHQRSDPEDGPLDVDAVLYAIAERFPLYGTPTHITLFQRCLALDELLQHIIPDEVLDETQSLPFDAVLAYLTPPNIRAASICEVDEVTDTHTGLARVETNIDSFKSCLRLQMI